MDLDVVVPGLSAGGVSALAPVIAAVAVLLVAHRGSWRVLRHVVTIGHEGGHAVTALLTGRKLNGIRLHSDTSGLTVSTGRASGPGMVLTLLAGYPAASLLGLAGAWLVSTGRTGVMLWSAVALLAAMLPALRNVYGVVSVVATGGALLAVSVLVSPSVQALCGGLLSWLLLLGGLRPVVELARKRARRRVPDSDADQLARLTRVPAPVWLLCWFAAGLAAAAVGGRWLLLSVGG